MDVRKRIAAMAATGALAMSIVAVSGASPAQAASDPRCVGSETPPSGSMCVHIHNTNTNQWYWFGPWSSCVQHEIPIYDQVTWVKSNQVGFVMARLVLVHVLFVLPEFSVVKPDALVDSL